MGGTLLPLDEATKQLASLLVFVLKGALDVLYRDRADFARFFVLETVARVPYFAYLSVLHLYESLGRHKRASWMKVHFAEGAQLLAFYDSHFGIHDFDDIHDFAYMILHT
jgi:hypothetical protein